MESGFASTVPQGNVIGNTHHQKKHRILLIFGSVLLTAGCMGFIYIAKNDGRERFEVFTSDNILFKTWSNPSLAEVYLKIYVFNITNQEAFLEGSERLKVEQVGPYIFRKELQQLNPVFNYEDGTVTTNPKYIITWLDELNILKMNDTLFVPNFIMLLSASHPTLKEFFDFFVKFLNEPIIQTTFTELMYGRSNTLMEIAKRIHEINVLNLRNSFFNAAETVAKINSTGLINLIYNLEDATTTYTGFLNKKKTGLLHSYNNLTRVFNWSLPCGKISGSSNGVKFGNWLNSSESIFIFRRMLCRALSFTPVEVEHGISSNNIVYHLSEDMFDNQANKCYCRNGTCLPNGLADISHCFFDFPVAISNPHFYGADPSLFSNIDGLKPNENLHTSYIKVDQETGTPTNLSIKLQTNLILKNIDGLYTSFSNMTVPFFIIEIEMEQLPLLYQSMLFSVQALPYLLLLVASILIITGIIIISLILKLFIDTIKYRSFSCKTLSLW